MAGEVTFSTLLQDRNNSIDQMHFYNSEEHRRSNSIIKPSWIYLSTIIYLLLHLTAFCPIMTRMTNNCCPCNYNLFLSMDWRGVSKHYTILSTNQQNFRGNIHMTLRQSSNPGYDKHKTIPLWGRWCNTPRCSISLGPAGCFLSVDYWGKFSVWQWMLMCQWIHCHQYVCTRIRPLAMRRIGPPY